MTQFISSPASAASAGVAVALRRHFTSAGAATAAYVRERLRQIAQRLRTDLAARSLLTVECHTGADDPNCRSFDAYVWVDPQLLVFCPTFFGGTSIQQVRGMVHEIAHSLATGANMFIADRAYGSDRKYGNLAPGEALTNAESYAMLAAELGLGYAVESSAPVDPVHGCPADWTPLLAAAVADAQRWNRDALTAIVDRRPGILAQYASLCDSFLGGHASAVLDAAARDYREMLTGFSYPIDFECEPGGGGGCGALDTYVGWPSLHVCPRWRTRATADDRAESILIGLYGDRGNVESESRRQHLAGLARAIHYRLSAPPSQADVAAALVPHGPGTPPAP